MAQQATPQDLGVGVPERAEGVGPALPFSEEAMVRSPLGRLPARTPFVGRVAEREFLTEQFAAVAAGAGGQLFLITGDAGAGKTRLAREVGLYALQHGGVFLEGRYLREGSTPYAPWVETLRAGIRDLSPDELAQAVGHYGRELAQLLPELEDQWNPRLLSPRRSSEERQLRLYDGIARLLVHISLRAPLVVLLDDLQWSQGLAVLAHVARQLKEARALIVGTYREQEFREQPALVRDRGELYRARLFRPLALQPLAVDHTTEMVAHTFGGDLAAQVGDVIHTTTQGNPFFVEEVLRDLVERGIVRLVAEGWELADRSPVTLPESVKLVIEDRVVRLGEGVRDVLAQAAVLGHEFGLPVLQAMTGLDEPALVDCVERAVAARLLVDRSVPGEERYAFLDGQMQEMLYSGLSSLRRRRLHLRAGQALEAAYRDRLGTHVEDLARHFTEGNDLVKAAEYLVRAGDAATQLYSINRARSHYAQALEALSYMPNTDDIRRRWIDTFGKQARVSFFVDLPTFPHLAEAEALARTLLGPDGTFAEDRLRLARVHFLMGLWAQAGNQMPKALEYLQQAQDVAQELRDQELMVLCLAAIGRVLTYQGHFDRAEPLLAGAVTRLEEASDWYGWINTTGFLGVALAGRGQHAAGLATAERTLATAHQLNNLTSITLGHLYVSFVCLMGGDALRMFEESRAGVATAERTGNQLLLYIAHALRAWAASRLGDHETALRSMAQSEQVGKRLGEQRLMADTLAAGKAEISLNAGRIDDAAAIAEEAVALAEATGGLLAKGMAQRVWGQALAARAPVNWMHVEECLTASLQAFEAGGASLEAARTHLVWGLLARDRHEQSTARTHLQQAADRFEAARLASELDAVRQALHGLDGRGRATARLQAGPQSSAEPFPDGLTAREIQVLRLIAAGSTTKEIAAELVVSAATVERHISNIYGKINARGRADATAYALSHGLVPSPRP